MANYPSDVEIVKHWPQETVITMPVGKSPFARIKCIEFHLDYYIGGVAVDVILNLSKPIDTLQLVVDKPQLMEYRLAEMEFFEDDDQAEEIVMRYVKMRADNTLEEFVVGKIENYLMAVPETDDLLLCRLEDYAAGALTPF